MRKEGDREGKKETDKIADIRYGGERRAGRGYRDIPVGRQRR